MNQKLKTSLALARNLFVTGAISETSEKLQHAICTKIPAGADTLVVEFGMGHGNITQKILDKLNPQAQLIAFEVNPEFCDHVRGSIKDPRLTIVNAGAEAIKDHVSTPVDAVVSSIPFTLLSSQKADHILHSSFAAMAEGAYFSQVLYSRFHFKRFKAVFVNSVMERISYFPPEFVYYCQKLS